MRCSLLLIGTVALIDALATPVMAGDAEDRAHRYRCVQLVNRYGSFDIPASYQAVSVPGGIITTAKRDGTILPLPTDVGRMGAKIETSPTDNFGILPLGRMHPVPVKSGTLYSQVECDGLNCLFKVGFVPAAQAAVAAECGVVPSYLRIDGVSNDGLAAARRAIRFRWGTENEAIPLTNLEPGK